MSSIETTLLLKAQFKMDKKSLSLADTRSRRTGCRDCSFQPAPLISYASSGKLYAVLMIVLVAMLSVLMVSTLRFSSFKR